jgi:hypothetical protein
LELRTLACLHKVTRLLPIVLGFAFLTYTSICLAVFRVYFTSVPSPLSPVRAHLPQLFFLDRDEKMEVAHFSRSMWDLVPNRFTVSVHSLPLVLLHCMVATKRPKSQCFGLYCAEGQWWDEQRRLKTLGRRVESHRGTIILPVLFS